MGKLTPEIAVGAAYSTKIGGKFNEYKGLFAEQGGGTETLSLSQNSLGIAWGSKF